MKIKIINSLRWIILFPSLFIINLLYLDISDYIIEEFYKRLEVISNTNSIFTTSGSLVIFENFQFLIICFISCLIEPFIMLFIGGSIAPTHKRNVKIFIFWLLILFPIAYLLYSLFINPNVFINIKTTYLEMPLLTLLKHIAELIGYITGSILSYYYLTDKE